LVVGVGVGVVLVVEELLAEMEVLQRCGAALTDPQRVLIVGDGRSLLGGQRRDSASSRLVQLAAAALVGARAAMPIARHARLLARTDRSVEMQATRPPHRASSSTQRL
jgi:hypothetical protein